MIPKKLTLKNFTSYGNKVKPFEFDQFQLACLSGPNGAGKSSVLDAITYALWGEARGKSPDDLVKLGEQQMEVEFEFILEKNLYRVYRTRSLKRKATELSLFSLRKKEAPTNLSEGTIKETQFKIDQLLKMSYETFVNSAFLKQGKADEFTLKGPADRKRILGEILGLQIYEELEKQAKEKSKEVTQEMLRLEAQLGEIENELTQSEIREEQMKQTQAKVDQLEEKLKAVEKEIKQAQKEKEAYLVIKNDREQREKLISRDKKEINELMVQIKKDELEIEKLTTILKNRDEIEKKFQTYKQRQRENEELNKKQAQLLKLKDQLNSAKEDYQKETANLQRKLTGLEIQKKQVEKEGLRIKADLEKTQKQKANCPLCGNELDTSHKKEVLQKLAAEKKEKGLAYLKIVKEIKELKTKTPSTKRIEESQKLIQQIGYDEKEHRLIEQELSRLQKLEKEKSILDSSQASYQSQEKTLKERKEFLGSRQKSLSDNEKMFEKTPDVSDKLIKTESLLKEKESQQKILLSQEREARSILGEAKGLVTRSKQLAQLKKDKGMEKEKFAQEKVLYDELTLAFGKKGIQAMLIETAVPEIEEETNRLLDRLTDGRMRITLQTQRDTQKGDTIETLDIIISDELGSRAYEMYSGGETFRVNFALRLALSKLLTHRAGTKLQFLVIDEGFGTQDTEGRERLIEIINQIKDDFEKILVITHIEELKEMFPIRLEVEKKHDGSNYKLVGVE